MLRGCDDGSYLIGQGGDGKLLELTHVSTLNRTWMQRDRVGETVAIGHQLVESGPLFDVPIPHKIPEPVPPLDTTISSGDWVDKNVTVRNDYVCNRVVDSIEGVTW